MTIDKALNEIFFRLQEKRDAFIKISAINTENKNSLVYTTYGLVRAIDRETIYFSYKRTSNGQNGPLIENNKNYECYKKKGYEYNVVFIENFDKEDFSRLIDLTLYETFKLPVYTAFKKFLNNM